MTIRLLTLWIVWGMLTGVLGAQSLSIRPLVEALQSEQLFGQDETARVAAQGRVLALLRNQPAAHEREPLAQRLADIARHRETRLGRMFFAALTALPEIENLPPETSEAQIALHVPLEMGSGVRIRAAWTSVDGRFLVSQLAVEVTGNAGALVAAAAPYFAPGRAATRVLEAPELDWLLGRPQGDTEDFDFAAALARRFAMTAGEPAKLTTELATGLATSQPLADRLALLSRLLPAIDATVLQAAMSAPGAAQRIATQAQAMASGPRPSAAPVFEGAGISLSARTGNETRRLALTRLAAGVLSPALDTEAANAEGN